MGSGYKNCHIINRFYEGRAVCDQLHPCGQEAIGSKTCSRSNTRMGGRESDGMHEAKLQQSHQMDESSYSRNHKLIHEILKSSYLMNDICIRNISTARACIHSF